MLRRRRESQRCRKPLDEEEWTQLMSVLPMLLGLIADLPVEQAYRDLNRAESIGQILDPTLFREYIYSGKGDELKDVLNALARVKAIALNQMEARLDAQAEAS